MYQAALCLGLSSTFGLPEPEQIRVFRQIGFEGFFTDWAPGKDLSALRAVGDECGMIFQSVHAPFTKMADMWGKDEAKARIAAADETARHHGERVVAEAKEKAQGILRQAEAEAELERQKATASIRDEIADVSAELAEKMLEREINAEDHRAMIASFLDQVGDAT